MVEMKILGIDPGTARIGWGVIVTDRRMNARVQTYDCIETDKHQSPEKRLARIYESIGAVIAAEIPDTIAVEELYFSKNVTSALAVAHARGVILLAAAHHGIPVVSYTPQSIKQTICGNGHADKQQVQRMVARLLHLRSIPAPDDIADALAVAITHAHHFRLKEATA